MVDYTKSTGNAGTLIIRDLGKVVELRIKCTDGATNVSSLAWAATVNGGNPGGNVSLPAGFGEKLVASYTVTTSQTMEFAIAASGTQGLGGPTTVTAAINRTVANSAPPAPDMHCLSPNPDQITSTSMRVRFCSTGTGSAPIIKWELRYGTNSATLDTTGTTITSTGTSVVPGLLSGTKYYFKARGVNSVGNGAWSAIISGTTIPAAAPGLTVTPSSSGTSATLKFTPPGNVTGVTRYYWERRLSGTTTPVATGQTTTNSATVSGLVPGELYEWRASAWLDTYQSPWTSWVEVAQPRPILRPGDYFDGDTADTIDIDYGWTGTANNSPATASAKVPLGWFVTYAAGAAGVLHQATGGLNGSKNVARVVVTSDESAAGGISAGMAVSVPYTAQVTGGGLYVGSMYVQPSRAQNMAAQLRFFDEDSVFISAVTGTAALLPAGSYTRLTVSATAPDNAVYAAVRVLDVAGTGWVAWQSGEAFRMDGAMVSLAELFPYFDGDTKDTIDYSYEWLGTANASASTRTPTGSDVPTGLFECDPPPAPPRPPTIPNECIEDSGIWRRQWVAVPAAEISNWLASLPTVTLTTTDEAVGQTRIRVYENPGNLPVDQIDVAGWVSEQIVVRIPEDTEIIVDSVDQRAWASVEDGPLIPADSLLFGTGGTPATWPVLKCGIDYYMTIDTPLEDPIGAVQPALELTRRLI